MRKIKYLFIILYLPFIAISGTVRIIGTAPGAEGKRIEVIKFTDLITFQEKNVAEAMVDSTGKFTLSFNLNETIYAMLSIDFHRSELLLEPSRSYFIKIESMDYNEMKEVNPFIESTKLEVSFMNDDPTELNFLVQVFDNAYNDFLLKNFNALYRERNKARLDTFQIQMESTFIETQNQYFRSYFKYKLAGLYQLTQTISQPQIGKTYFMDQPILYENVEYMKFMNDYFKKYLTATCRTLKFTNYNTLLSEADPYKAMMLALAKDSILKKSQLRELVMLKGLDEMYNTTGFDKEKVMELIRKLSAESKYPETRMIAENIILVLTKLRIGSAAPPFKLKNRDQKEVTLAAFRGKPVVLNFWTTYCQGCITEMDMMKPIYDKYKDQVVFISIAADKNLQKMNFFLDQKKDFVWNFLHLGENFNLLKDYEVKSYPLYVLIDKNGNISQYPADLPDSGLNLS